MELINRYVYAVTERLPEDTREDVARELRANIEDMLPDDASEADIRAVLENLGDPAALSNEYRQTKKYLIGPAMYDSYISVLKLVTGIVAIFFAFLGVLGVLTEPGTSIPDMIIKVLASPIEGVLWSFLWVTVVFVILERTDTKKGDLPFNKKKWSVDDLSESPVHPKNKISRGEAIVSLIFLVIFTSILLLRPELFGWFEVGDDGLRLVAPVFNIERLQFYYPAIIILVVIEFSLSVYKFIARKWTFRLATVNTLANAASILVVWIVFTDRSLYSQSLISHAAAVLEMTAANLETFIAKGIQTFLVLFVVLNGIDSIDGFVRSRKRIS